MVVLRGECKSCGRQSTLIDRINYWCAKCATDPDYRNKMGKQALIRGIFWTTFVISPILLIIAVKILEK